MAIMETGNKIPLKIITPNGVFWNQPVNIVTVKTTEGYIGLQKGHMPFVASLAIDELHINMQGTPGYKRCAVAGGLVFTSKEEVSIITDSIEYSDTIDLARAERDRKEAELIIKEKQLSDSEHHHAELALEKAINRIKVRSGK